MMVFRLSLCVNSDLVTQIGLVVNFWRKNLRSLNSRPLWRKHILPSRVVYLDTSSVGCAAFISLNDRLISHKN